MHNLLFFLWMLFFPLVDDISTYITTLYTGKKVDEKAFNSFTSTAMLLIYFITAYLLYEKK